MKLLYFHQHFTTPDGSWGTRSYEMAKALVAAGHDVTMVCGSAAQGRTGLTGPFRRGRREGDVEGIHIVELELPYANNDGLLKRSIAFLRFAARAMQIAVTRRADLVFATTTPLTAALPGIAARWLRGRRFVFEVRDLWPEIPREMGVIRNPVTLAMLGALEWVGYRSASHLIGLAPGIVRGIARLGVPPERITLIPNGCDIQMFSDGAAAVRSDGIAADDLLAVFTGTHGPANGLDAVLDAAAVLKARGERRVKLLLVGDGKDKASLVARTAAENLWNIVRFAEPMPKRALPGLMKCSDIGMQILADVPAFYEGTSPNKFFDYLAAGLPILTNYPGWVADLVSQSGAGIAVKPRDPESFADALQALLAEKDRGTLVARKTASAALGAREFDRALLAARFVATLEQAAGLRR
ncbi:glycosyltransferase family 4 protein [Sphingomonas sp. SUN039]|uniref:glycosyltransferase family 4 protein n=1 Tax=Sphingomonas sp. SUN039 TaxID=2937787 RepID=UPI0021649657|nr:glycosyltransferase family 4 protein [Sphingomonas sp. SUN039]UVO52852.1 glycosyltransferase family 4 protein [Sphingomonas sp. SUN039]